VEGIRLSQPRTLAFDIETELKPVNFADLVRFIWQTYIFPRQDRFANVQRSTVNGVPTLGFRLIDPQTASYIDVQLRTGHPTHIEMVASDARVPTEALDDLRQDLTFEVESFEEQIRQTSLYFAWVEGEEGIPERRPPGRHSLLHRLFADSMLTFFVLFIGVSIMLFLFIGLWAVVMLVGIQFVMVMLSGRIIEKTGDWQVTARNPYVHLFQYQLPFDDYLTFVREYRSGKLERLKQDIYDQTLARGQPVDCKSVEQVLGQYGYRCSSENTSTKTVNVYNIVKTAAEKFRVRVPSIVIANTVIPNAAASGPSPGQGVMVITTGLLAQLRDDEILGVVGHEFGHLKARDPLVLFGITAGEFLLRIYLFTTYNWLFFAIPVLAYGYLLVALGVVYFIAKFFEARADLDSAIKIGQPKVLAEALRKIGFRRLQFERSPAFRVGAWTGWDPHPPIYYRVARLDRLQDPARIKHPLLRSIKENIQGFSRAFRGQT
jgi:heat shock protein HtpX